jgi:hypothetical protein
VVSYATLTDSAAHLAADAVTNAGAGTFVTAGHDVTVNTTATVLELTEIDQAAGVVTYTSVTDTAGNLDTDALSNAGAGTYVTAGHNVSLAGTASIQQLIDIDHAAGVVSYSSVTDTEANLTANVGGYIAPGINLTVTDTATLTQLAILDGMNGATGTVTADIVSDTLANLTLDAATNGGAGTYVIAGHNATVTDSATIAQLANLDALANVGTVTATSVSDTLADIQADHNGGAHYASGHNVTVTDSASVAELTAISGYATSVTATSVHDTLSDIQADHASGAHFTTGHNVTVDDAATVTELTAIDLYAGTVTATSIHDTAANLAADAATHSGLGTYVTNGVTVTVDDTASIAQMTAIHTADSTGTMHYSITDSAADIQAALDGGTGLNLVQHATTIDASDNTLNLSTGEFNSLLAGSSHLAANDTIVLNGAAGGGLALHNYGGDHTIVLGGDQNGSYFVSLGASGDTTIHLGGTGDHVIGATNGVTETFILDTAQNGGSVITGLSATDHDVIQFATGAGSVGSLTHDVSVGGASAVVASGDWSFSGNTLTYYDNGHHAVESLTLVGSITTLTQVDGHTFHA